MPTYQLEVATTGRESYEIVAENEAHARQIFENDAPVPTISEVITCAVESVEVID
jgi:hypothetical protein